MSARPVRTRLFVAVMLFAGTAGIGAAQTVDVNSWPKRPERAREFDAVHYRIALKLDDEKKTFRGENTITLSPLSNGFTRCVLDAETFKVTSVENKKSEPLEFEQTDHELIVHLGKPYDRRDEVSFTVSYYADTRKADPRHPRRGGNGMGLGFTEATPDNPAVISALSFPTGARHWFPCYDHPNDKATLELIVTVRSDYQVLANGRLLGTTENKADRSRTFHWSQEQPHSTYLTMMAAGPYHIVEDSLGSLPIRYWVYEKDARSALVTFSQTPKIIEFFNGTYGYKYPWAKYDQITLPRFGGGAECTSATLMHQGIIHDQRADQDFSSLTIVAHEAAHQWWGDLVTLRDWSEVWLNEGFSTYGDYLYNHHHRGPDHGAVHLLGHKNSYLREARTRYIRPIVFDRWNKPQDLFDRHAYQKAAAVLHMMRFVMGDEPFFQTHKHFLHKHAFQPVDTHDFSKAIKEATGQNLDWFFDQWFFRPGHPVFDVRYTWDQPSRKLNVTVEQVQDTSKGVPIYRTPVIIGIVTPGGKRSEKVWLTNKVEEFEFPCAQEPLLVRFDQGNYLLKEWSFPKTRKELLYQLQHDDVIGRMWAASQLGKTDNHESATAALWESACHDPFWPVRRAALENVGVPRGPDDIELLKQKCQDQSSRVRALALRKLGDTKQGDLAGFFLERFGKDDSYVAQAEALRAVGKCGDESSVAFLEEAAKMDSPRNTIRAAANWALKQLDR